MVPFSSFTQVEETMGLNLVSRYNMYSSAALTAIPAPGDKFVGGYGGYGAIGPEYTGYEFRI